MNENPTLPRRWRVIRWATVLVAATLSATAPVAGAKPEIEDLDRIRATVTRYLKAEFESKPGNASFELGPLDPRLRLPRCTKALRVDPRTTASAGMHQRVAVRCEGEKPWALYVPVTITRSLPVVVAARAVGRGAPLTPDMVEVATRRVDGVHGEYFTSPAQVTGMSARRPLSPGHVLGPRDLEVATVVQRGQRVTIATYAAGIEVRTQGTALADGGQGQRIPVRNERSDRIVYGQVTADGRVNVNAPPSATGR